MTSCRGTGADGAQKTIKLHKRGINGAVTLIALARQLTEVTGEPDLCRSGINGIGFQAGRRGDVIFCARTESQFSRRCSEAIRHCRPGSKVIHGQRWMGDYGFGTGSTSAPKRNSCSRCARRGLVCIVSRTWAVWRSAMASALPEQSIARSGSAGLCILEELSCRVFRVCEFA